MKSLIVAFLIFYTSTVEGDPRLSDEELEKILGDYFQSLKNIYHDMTDRVLDNLFNYFMKIKYDTDVDIPTIKGNCIKTANNFIKSDAGINQDIVKFLKTVNISLFTKKELSRIVSIIQMMSLLQTKIICLTVH